MKKCIKYLALVICMLIPINVFASGGISVSTSNISIINGSSSSFKVTASNAAGKVVITSSDKSVITVDKSSEWLDNQTITVNVKSLKVGTAKIYVKIDDVATYDGEVVSGTKTINVTVSEKTTRTTTIDTRSKDSSLKSISVDGYQLTKVDERNYTSDVSNSVSTLNINAVANDEKASISGIGNKEIKVGENNFEIIVTAENGTRNKINIKVTKKDGYYLEDLSEVLKNNDKVISIILNKDTITSKELESIKTSGKTIELCKYDNNKNLAYVWIIDGTKLSNTNDFSTGISINNEEYKKIYEKTNYVEGLYVEYKEKNNIPDGITLKLYVGSLYDSDTLNLYSYNKDSFKLIEQGINSNGKYLEYDVKDLNNTLITKATLNKASNLVTIAGHEICMYFVISIIECIITIVLSIMLIRRIKKN